MIIYYKNSPITVLIAEHKRETITYVECGTEAYDELLEDAKRLGKLGKSRADRFQVIGDLQTSLFSIHLNSDL